MSVERNARAPDSESDARVQIGRASTPHDQYQVRETPGAALRVETRRQSLPVDRAIPGLDHDRFFLAEQRPDGNYGITLTEQGVKTFETALGIANDLGGNSLISPYSTIADIMDRTATREELSLVLRGDLTGAMRAARITVLRRKLRGSERPSARQAIVGHIGKLTIVLLFVFWAIQQFVTAVQDITAIPGILSSVPNDILHPDQSFGQVSSNISDAGFHFLLGLAGLILVYIVGALLRPFARIYRKDALIPGERMVLRFTNACLARLADRKGGDRVTGRATKG